MLGFGWKEQEMDLKGVVGSPPFWNQDIADANWSGCFADVFG